ncbi:helix-turn-helix domain-containing protein [Streptomyces sp. NPDC058049]|uniref:helix-turn-helix domain-containing protein n=1 Tax=Streptomyces sp. NPDC058049 TaxID=3346314 RepID=UPI0036EDAE45
MRRQPHPCCILAPAGDRRPPPRLGAHPPPALPRQEETETVQARIRRRCLERRHGDLARPEPMGHPVNAIAARWGFSGPAVFSRSFRERCGLTPTEFRALSVKDGRAVRTSS